MNSTRSTAELPTTRVSASSQAPSARSPLAPSAAYPSRLPPHRREVFLARRAKQPFSKVAEMRQDLQHTTAAAWAC